jgi:uncharacterized OsmC-like protein
MRKIEVAELSALCGEASAAQLVDVRSAGEFAAGHVPGAMNNRNAQAPRHFFRKPDGRAQRREDSMQITVEHLGAVQFLVKAREHSIVSDQPAENGGFDEGMTPPELMLASLGSCAGFYAAQYLKKKGLAAEGSVVRVFAEKAKGPARLDNFRIEVDVPGAVDEEHRKGVEEAVHHCLIHNTLLHPPSIALEVRSPAQLEISAVTEPATNS